MRRQTKGVIEKASTPQEGTEPLAFATVYPRNFAQQVGTSTKSFPLLILSALCHIPPHLETAIPRLDLATAFPPVAEFTR